MDDRFHCYIEHRHRNVSENEKTLQPQKIEMASRVSHDSWDRRLQSRGIQCVSRNRWYEKWETSQLLSRSSRSYRVAIVESSSSHGLVDNVPTMEKTHWNDRVSRPHGGNRNGLMWCRVCLWVVWILSILSTCFFDAKYIVVFVVGSSGGCCDRNLFEEVQLKNK
eukprot:PhF_6_TR11024/c0_g1_i2/m.17860